MVRNSLVSLILVLKREMAHVIQFCCNQMFKCCGLRKQISSVKLSSQQDLFQTTTIFLKLRYPDKDWNLLSVSSNPIITIKMINNINRLGFPFSFHLEGIFLSYTVYRLPFTVYHHRSLPFTVYHHFQFTIATKTPCNATLITSANCNIQYILLA